MVRADSGGQAHGPRAGRRQEADPSPPAASGGGGLRWRVIADAPLPGPTNMARDHALARGLSAGAGVLRFYGWVPATVSFGKNEPARGLYLQEEAEREGVAFVRRPTGGRAVLHHQELTYAVVFPLGVFGGLRDSYHLINRGLMTGLRLLGAAAELALGTGPGLPPNAGPCFRQPAEGEVTAVGRKLVGSAQVRLGPCVLQHGSLILDGDQDLLRRIRVGHAVVPPPATLRSLLGAVPETGRLTSALQQGLALTLGGSWHESAFRKEEEAAARELEEHYRDPEWTWRL